MKKNLLLPVFLLTSLILQADFLVIHGNNALVQERTAAEELAQHLEKATGEKCRIITEKEAEKSPVKTRKIYVGNTAYLSANKIDTGKMGREEWLIKSVSADSLILAGGYPGGTLYAVYEFLEKELGVIWPDEHFTYVPRNNDYSWKHPLFSSGKPSFEFRGSYAYFKHDKHKRLAFMVRNRENLFTDDIRYSAGLKKYGVPRVYGSPRSGAHTFYFYTKDWGEKEKDCLSLDSKGNRLKAVSPRGPGQVCFTNPRTRDLFEKQLREYIRLDRKEAGHPRLYPRIYMISHNDNRDICVCSGCKTFVRKHGAAALLMDFVNDLARRIKKDHPEIYIQTSGYAFATQPPTENFKNESNVIVQFASMGSEFARCNKEMLEERYHSDSIRPVDHPNNARRYAQLKAWSKLGKLALWDYWILFEDRRPVPAVFARDLAANIKTYHKMGAVELMAECERPVQTAFYALRLWLGYRMLNNVSLEPDKEIDRFMHAYYGKGAPFMRKLLDYMQFRQDSVKERIGGIWLHDRKDLDDDYVKTTQTLLDKAEKAAAGDENSLKHIGFERCHNDILTLDLARLKNDFSQLDLDKILKRLLVNHSNLCEAYLNPKKAAVEKNGMMYYIKGFKVQRPLLPAELNLRKEDVIADIFWPEFQQHYWGRLTPDKEAAGGYCLKASKDTRHHRGIQFGYQCAMRKKGFFPTARDIRKVASNEKYNFFCYKDMQLSQSCYVWAHWTWTLQVDLSPYWKKLPSGTPVDIYFSLKWEGPDYFKGSKKENAVSVDRVIVVKKARK
ncbi:MAG: DUF4838 domain-containing protein [Lentisphaeria bacterium]|nr:DUF4838 domain-containing protein [Lentisphaeria bacterium]